LQQFLGIDPKDERAVEMVRDLTEFEAAELDALDWGDEARRWPRK
jgi:electron transfer flavoprotein alpha/beta subunit